MAKARDKKNKDISDFNEMVNLAPTCFTTVLDVKAEIVKNIPNNIRITAKNESQMNLINSIKNNQITICSGDAGSGKTYVAIGEALSLFRKANSSYKKIYLVKSVTQLEGEEMGFLKGDIKDKFEPYMSSYYLNIEKLIPESALRNLINKEIIKPAPIAYVRGVTIDDSIVIIDELQNVRINSLKTLMTRIGENCKYILLGDTGQIDLKVKGESSLAPAIKMFKDFGTDINVVEMSSDDENVRNKLIKPIIAKFDDWEKQKKHDNGIINNKHNTKIVLNG